MPDRSVSTADTSPDRLEVIGADAVAPAPVAAHPVVAEPVPEHTVRIVERGPFAVAVCDGCRWESFARRSRRLARSEGRDHELLHAP